MMTDHETRTTTVTDADARRLALEAIATLVYVKKTAADQALRRAGVPEELGLPPLPAPHEPTSRFP